MSNVETIYTVGFGDDAMEILHQSGSLFFPNGIGIKVPHDESPWMITEEEGRGVATAILKAVGAPVIEEVNLEPGATNYLTNADGNGPGMCDCATSDECTCFEHIVQSQIPPVVDLYNKTLAGLPYNFKGDREMMAYSLTRLAMENS